MLCVIILADRRSIIPLAGSPAFSFNQEYDASNRNKSWMHLFFLNIVNLFSYNIDKYVNQS